MHEFAYGITSENEHFGDVVNPLDPERIAGGSSGGSAAALAAGLCDAALGTDSGGSIRIPAACCGIVGFKPTYGLVPVEGSFPLAPSFDHAGPMARDVAACAAILTALAPGFEPRALDSLEEVSVVVIWLDEARPLVRERVVQASRRFPRRRKGVLPFAADSYALFRHEVAAVHGELFAEHRERYGRDVRTKIERCLAVSDEEAAVAAAARERYRDRCLEALGNADLLLSPTLASVAPPTGIGDLALRDELIRFTYPFNAVGWPALALPCGPAEEGLPASLQLVGRPGADALVLAAGAALAAALA